MEYPPGMIDAEDNAILALSESIYGLVQAVRQYHKWSRFYQVNEVKSYVNWFVSVIIIM